MDVRDDEVFLLLKSMSEKEKKFFLKSARKGSFYLKLYELIENKSCYDEKQLNKHLDKAGCKQPLYKLKNYLKSELLKSICDFHKNSDEQLIITQLAQLNVLTGKGLFEIADKILDQVKEFTIRKAQYKFLPVIYNHENLIKTHLNKLQDNVFDEYLHFFQNKVTHTKLDKIYNRIQKLHAKHYTIKDNEILRKEVEELLEDPIIKFNPEDDDIKLRLTRLMIWSTYYQMIADIENNLKYSYSAIEILDKYPDVSFYKKIKSKVLKGIVTTLNNFNQKDVFLREKDKIIQELELLAENDINLLPALLQAKFKEMNVMCAFENANLYIDEFVRNQKKFSPVIQAALQIDIVLVYAKMEDFENTIDWLTRLIKLCEKNDLQYHLLGFRVIEVWIHFKFGNYRLVNSLIQSVTRQMKNFEVTSLPYDYLVDGVKAFLKAQTKDEKIGALVNWKLRFDAMSFTDKMHFNNITFSFSDELEKMIEVFERAEALEMHN